MDYVRLFTGWDQREAVGWHAFTQSVIERSTLPVAFIPLGSKFVERDGTNSFTYSRFLVPWLCGYQGFAIFVDGVDMLARFDIARLWDLRKEMFGQAVAVVKHDYRTKHERKYVGTKMEALNADYPRKNWSSVVIWNCSHYLNRGLTPEFVKSQIGPDLQRFAWLPDDRIGEIPPEWNLLVGEQEGEAKLAHYTLGIPGFKAYRDSAYADEWFDALQRSQQGKQT